MTALNLFAFTIGEYKRVEERN